MISVTHASSIMCVVWPPPGPPCTCQACLPFLRQQTSPHLRYHWHCSKSFAAAIHSQQSLPCLCYLSRCSFVVVVARSSSPPPLFPRRHLFSTDFTSPLLLLAPFVHHHHSFSTDIASPFLPLASFVCLFILRSFVVVVTASSVILPSVTIQS